MLRMTKQTDYGIMVLSHFANSGDGTIHTARDVAAETEVPFPMVSKILKLLARKGLLESHRGVRGGYQLKRDAHAISVAEVISAFEGPLAITECSSGIPGECRVEHRCAVRNHWQIINHAVQRALEGITLSTMLGTTPQPLITLGKST